MIFTQNNVFCAGFATVVVKSEKNKTCNIVTLLHFINQLSAFQLKSWWTVRAECEGWSVVGKLF